jgi:phosphoribosylformylglycinamidine synthase PurS subunit
VSDTYSVEVRITPRQGILDPEGETIARALENLGYEGVTSVRAGRLVRMEVESPSERDARSRVEKMCEELIANPVIEDYEVRIGDTG